MTERARLAAPEHALAVVPTDFDNRRDVDLLVLRYDAPPALLKNLRDGTFRDVASEVGLVARGPFRSVAAGDVSKDGYVDFFLGGSGPSWLALSDGRGSFGVVPAPEATAGAEAAQFVDYDNDGLLDLFVVTPQGPRLLRNLGSSWSDVSADAFADRVRTAALEGAALGLADLDADGDQDAILATPQRLRSLTNEGGNRNRSFAVELAGRVSNGDGVGAKVEIRAGSLRQKIETSTTVPMAAPADVVFGLGQRASPDAVRVIWVSGIVQTETDFPAVAGGAAPGRAGGHGAGPQALVVSVPVRLDRGALRVPDRFPWWGGDGLRGGPRGLEPSRPRGVRARRPRAAAAPQRFL